MLLVARKVVKVISENQKSVVVQNIGQALRKLKTKSDVIVRVNLADLQLATEHIKDFVQMTENAKKMTDRRGFDGRSRRLRDRDGFRRDRRAHFEPAHELEERILDVAPIKARGKVQG